MTTSTNPANEGSLEGILKTVLNKFQMNLQICLPCVVTKVDRNKNRVSVLPLMDILLTDGTTMPRAEVFNVPIKSMGAGGFIINFPVKVGDYGWIRSCDRDISLFKQTYKRSKPNTRRKNSFEDAVFEPDTINHNYFTISGEDVDNLVIQSHDNTTKISMKDGKIVIQADEIELKATQNKFTGGTIKHDGISIDKTHIHSQGADSAGNTQADTTPPSN